MKRIAMLGAMLCALSLAACGAETPPPSTPSSTAPPGTHQPPVAKPPAAQPFVSTVVQTTMVQATQKLVVANEAYQLATVAIGAAVDGHAISPSMANTLRGLNQQAIDYLGKANRATLAADRLYFAERALDSTDAVKRLLGLPVEQRR